MVDFSGLARTVTRIWRPVTSLADHILIVPAWQTRHRNRVERIHAGMRDGELAKHMAVFVHFDRRGEVHDYVVFYLQSLLAAGFEILLVSNGNRLTSAAMERILPLCVGVIERRNVGYDFGAYRDGLRHLGDLSRFQRVLLANDSVYGPLFDLRQTLALCDESAAVWGMTDSWSIRYHLQSYFMLLNRQVLISPYFARFWQSLLLVQSKRAVIRFHEIGFTQAMLRAGLNCVALFPYRAAAEDLARAGNAGAFADKSLNPRARNFFDSLSRGVERGTAFNPLHHFWDHMISRFRCPFIKRDLLVSNPANIPHVYLWQRLIGSVSNYDTSLIARHLQLVTRNRAP